MIPHIGYAEGRALPIYNVSISDSARERWAKIAPDFKSPLTAFINNFDSLVPLPYFIYQIFGYFGLYFYHENEFV